MSVTNLPTPFLEILTQQHEMYTKQKEIAHNSFNQLVGAIHILEQLIKSEMEKQELLKENTLKSLADLHQRDHLGDLQNGEVINETKESSA
jgi:hypothetical protein